MKHRRLFMSSLLRFTAGLVVASFAGFRDFLPGLLSGAWVTVQITLAGCLLALLMGLVAGLAKLYGAWPVRWLAIAYIEIFRGTSQTLIVPLRGVPILITRAMESATVRDQVPGIRHMGYSDGIAPLPEPANRSQDLLLSAQTESGEAVGLEPWSMSLGIKTQKVAVTCLPPHRAISL